MTPPQSEALVWLVLAPLAGVGACTAGYGIARFLGRVAYYLRLARRTERGWRR